MIANGRPAGGFVLSYDGLRIPFTYWLRTVEDGMT
jgi:hypothetical protein